MNPLLAALLVLTVVVLAPVIVSVAHSIHQLSTLQRDLLARQEAKSARRLPPVARTPAE